MAVDFFPVPHLELLFTQRCNMACTYCFEPDKNKKKMSHQDMLDFVDAIAASKVMMFGGEPFMDIDILTTLYDAIQAKEMDPALKDQLLQSFTGRSQLITNGTLVEKYADVIKKYKLNLQISLDGPRELNDINRVYVGGKGTYDDVMKNVDFCIANNITWSIHGAIGRNAFKYLPAIFAFFWEATKRENHGNLDAAISVQRGNTFQILFEDTYTDEDVDILLQAQEQVFRDIMALSELTEVQKVQLAKNWFTRRGATCGAGVAIYALDSDMNVYPCHRPAMRSGSTQSRLGNLRDRSTFTNFKLFNNFQELAVKQFMNSASLPNHLWKGDRYQQNWCGAANLETSDSVFYQNAKYNLMIAEYTRFVNELFAYAKIPSGSSY